MQKLHKRLVEKYLSNKLYSFRKKNNLTQEKMSELLEIDVRSYSDIERHKGGMSLFTFLYFIAQNSLKDRTLIIEETICILTGKPEEVGITELTA